MILTPETLFTPHLDNGRVMTDGVFDPLHPGHIAHLDAAASYGPVYCHISEAWKHRAVVPLMMRAAVLDALRSVHAVYPHGSTETALSQIRPAWYVKGDEWRDHLPASQQQLCERIGCQIIYTETGHRASSSALLRRWQAQHDAAWLEQCDDRVRRQVAPAAGWMPVTDYRLEARRHIEGPHPALIWEYLIPRGGFVLDYGCGPDGCLVTLLREQQSDRGDVTIAGYDPQARHPQLRSEPPARAPAWDLVICREVLEHVPMREIAGLIETLCALSAQYVYVTARFHPDPTHLLDWEDHDTLDPDHRSLVNPNLLRALFVLHGFHRRADLETALDWQQQGRVLIYERA